MNLDSGPALLASVVDLLVIGCTVALLVYAVFTGMFRANPLTSSGRALIATGLSLGVVAQLSYSWFSLVGAGTAVLSPEAASWIHWLLTRLSFSMVGVGLFIAWSQRRRTDARDRVTARKLKTAESSIIQSESRYRYLFENTPNSVYCFSLTPPVPLTMPLEEQLGRIGDAVLTECNPMFAEVMGAERASDIIGQRLGLLYRSNTRQPLVDLARAFIENDYRLADYAFNYATPDGTQRAVRINLTGVVQGSSIVRVWAMETNILDLQLAQAEIERQRDFEELVASVSSRLLMSPDEKVDDVVIDCLRQVCEFGSADRASILWQDPKAGRADVSYIWRRDSSARVMERRLEDFPYVSRTLTAGKICRVDDVEKMPAKHARDRDSLLAIGIRSFVGLPLIVSGEVVGSATYGRSNGAHAWTDQDVLDMRVFAELFGNYVLRLKSRRALDDAMLRLQQASERLEAENVYLRQEIELTQGFDDIIGRSDAILHCLHLVEQVSDTMTTVLLLGETGTGKELIARAIHDHSPRTDRPLVKVNCAALPANLIESELFGHEKGAFTGAESAKRGRFDLAHGSTLFLDEIGEIPVELQAKLLRVLQEGEFERLGGSDTVKVDVRIIAATNRDLHQAVADGEFRSDLFFRINTFPIELPPLRARGDDIQLLVEHFVKVLSQDLGRDVSAISANMMHQLRDYHWPGNVRELEGVIERALIASSQSVLDLASPLVQLPKIDDDGLPKVISTSISDLRVVEREHILAILEETDWRISGDRGAATTLGRPPSTLRSKMKKLSIERPA
jgi:transcriptional regulator with GAF, ATPase, and Fis domain